MRPLEPGLTLRNWRLVRRLGRGADGDVWLAVDTHGREVALKARPREGVGVERRLRREFERLRTLRLPSVVRVLDVGTDQGYVFFTMEVAHGVAFDRYVQEARSLGERVMRLARAGAGVAHAMAGTHRLNLAHRDLKPENVLVAEDGAVTILDFGTMRFGASQDESGNFAGTVAYMAPEQRVGLPHDSRVDLYSMGVMLHEACSGIPAIHGVPGRPRPSLLLLGPEVPALLAHLVDALVAFDPAERPSAEETERVLLAVSRGGWLPPAPWPAPLKYVGDASPLLAGHPTVVVGGPGSGRRRMIAEARWLWYRKGYRSLAGPCAPDRPYGAIRAILAEVFSVRDPDERRRLAGDDATVLGGIWPELPVVHDAAAPPPAPAAAAALARLFGRLAPLAVILWDLDEADPGTSAVVEALVMALPPQVVIWGTSRRARPGLAAIAPPAWSTASEEEALAGLLPAGAAPSPGPGRTPLETAARAWRALAAPRAEGGPAREISAGLARLSVLEDPFPLPVAAALTEEVDALWASGHLLLVRPQDYSLALQASDASAVGGNEGWGDAGVWLAFADPGTRRLAEAVVIDRTSCHRLAAAAYEALPTVEERMLRGAVHRVRSGSPDPDAFRRSVRLARDRANPAEVERWLQLKDLYAPGPDDFGLAWARVHAALELRPARVSREALERLLAMAKTPDEVGHVALLQLQFEARMGDAAWAIEAGLRWAAQYAAEFPALAADLLRQVALARLDQDAVDPALDDCRRALVLAREAAWRATVEPALAARDGGAPPPAPRPPRLSRVEVDAATTLSAALLYAGRTREGTRLCEEMADRCRRAGLARGQGAFLANLAAGQLFLGQRDDATHSLARCRAVQSSHGDPLILAYATTYQARLAVERGDRTAARMFLDEAMTVGQALGSGHLQAEIWPLVLEAASHSADVNEAGRAISTYGANGVRSSADAWPAALGRWLWLAGDLEGALEAVSEPRIGHSGCVVAAERCRLLLVSGRYDAARDAAAALAAEARRADFAELEQLARLVGGAASAAPDATYTPLVAETRASRWVHLYLGALHLDAIRRQLRGENPAPVLRELRARSRDMEHTLYLALAREDAW